jgi:uncharacterized protein DUF1629
MVFYELAMLHQVGLGACSMDPVGKITRIESPRCDVCGERLGLLRRIPPYKYKLVSGPSADVITDGGVFAVSPRFKAFFLSSDLKGLEYSEDPINLMKTSATYFMAHPAYTQTLIDTEASGAVIQRRVGCDKCGAAGYHKIDRIVIREDTWAGEDVFTLSSLSGVVLTTQRFVDFVNTNQFTGFSFLHQDEYHYDYSSVSEPRPDKRQRKWHLPWRWWK